MGESYKPPFTMTDVITNMVVEIGELIGMISATGGLSMSPMLRRENRIKTIHSSLAIEQNTLTVEQVSDVIQGKRVLAPPQDIKEVKNAYEIYERLDELNPYSVRDLLKAHKVMMENLISEAGTFRSKGVGVYAGTKLIHAGTPPQYVPDLIAELFEWMRMSTLHPLMKSCIFHYEFEFIHPFADGNGRIGRLWHTLILSKWKPFFAWLPIESLIYENQEEYYRALNEANNEGESTAFVEFMLGAIEKALLELPKDAKEADRKTTDKMTDKTTDKMTDKDRERWERLNAYFENFEYIKNAKVQELLSVSDTTAKRFLRKLTDLEILEAEGERKERKYKKK